LQEAMPPERSMSVVPHLGRQMWVFYGFFPFFPIFPYFSPFFTMFPIFSHFFPWPNVQNCPNGMTVS
jgi:hypothetical protein